MQVLEGQLESKVARQAERQLGVLGLKFQPIGNDGWPDRLFIIPGGQPLFIEFKRPGEKPTPLQRVRIKFLKKLGYKVEVHDDGQRAFRAVERALEASRLHEKRRGVAVGPR